MRIVMCGAGLVGSAIASHLAAEQNDVTVIDADADKIQRVVEHADVRGVVGMASHPNILTCTVTYCAVSVFFDVIVVRHH